MNSRITNCRSGGDCFADTAAHVPTAPATNWEAIYVETDAVFTSITGNVNGLGTPLVHPAGTLLTGDFTALTLASGQIIAYNKA